MLELYAEIDVAGSSLMPVARGGHSVVAFDDEDEDYIRDLSSDENENDEGEIPDGDSSESEAELDSSAIAVSPVASSLHIREQLSREDG